MEDSCHLKGLLHPLKRTWNAANVAVEAAMAAVALTVEMMVPNPGARPLFQRVMAESEWW